ncbi:enoyl-CoA hydratase/isomerase family protein [Nocardia sp. CA-135398]|uniref:enoyl-CoA hydratase/isomerase family protein n=1 Tax=Nocardia sp. CA-135398 TaxID=3239977 RepID=UPI003D97A6CB
MTEEFFDPLEPPLLDDHGRVRGAVCVVDLDSADPSTQLIGNEPIRIGVAARALGTRARNLAARLDATVLRSEAADEPWLIGVPDPLEAVDVLCRSADANPHAALVLAQVLRATGTRAHTALDIESFAYSMLLGGPEFARWLSSRGPRSEPSAAQGVPVLVARTGDCLTVTLNRPDRRNAYGREMRDALVEALRLALLDDTVNNVILQGAGPCFSAGGDLTEFGTAPESVTAHFLRTSSGAGRLLYQLERKLEARLHGSCIGAGIELPAFAGRVTAARGTVFRLPEIGMGLIPGAGGTVSITRRIGRWRTMFLALTGQPLDVDTALGWGLIDAIE